MGDARSDNVLSDSEIRLLLETSTNEDGFELLKKIEKNTKNLFQFEKQVREIFPNAPKGKKKTKNIVHKFFTEYDALNAKSLEECQIMKCLLNGSE